MQVSGMDMVIVYSNGEYTFPEMDPFYYLSDFRSMGVHSVLFLPKEDDPILMITPRWDEDRAKRLSWISNIVAANDFAAEFGRLILGKKWKKAKVALAGGRRLTRPVQNMMASHFEVSPQMDEQIVNKAAKTFDKLEMMRAAKASEIAEQGYQYLLQIAKPGMKEYELAAETYCYMKALGADDNFQLLSASQHNSAVTSPQDRRLDVGDVILAEISPSYDGQFIQICRTAVIGSATQLQLDKYQILINAMVIGMKTGIPGAKAKDVTKAVNDSIAESGYGEYCYPPYMRVRGHGLGLGSIQPGQLSMENETVLEEGMVFILHPNQYIPEPGYLLCGESVVVTKTGLVPLTNRQLALDSISV
jgi:Xaa-Pro aminopeptidase